MLSATLTDVAHSYLAAPELISCVPSRGGSSTASLRMVA